MLHWHRPAILNCFWDIKPIVHPNRDLDLSGSRDVWVTWPFDSSYTISYRCSIGTDTLSPTDFEILKFKCIEVTTWPFKVMWRHRSRDHSTPTIWLPIGAPLTLTRYLELFLRYYAYSANKSRLWPLRVTWRHLSRDHSIPHIRYPIGCLLYTSDAADE